MRTLAGRRPLTPRNERRARRRRTDRNGRVWVISSAVHALLQTGRLPKNKLVTAARLLARRHAAPDIECESTPPAYLDLIQHTASDFERRSDMFANLHWIRLAAAAGGKISAGRDGRAPFAEYPRFALWLCARYRGMAWHWCVNKCTEGTLHPYAPPSTHPDDNAAPSCRARPADPGEAPIGPAGHAWHVGCQLALGVALPSGARRRPAGAPGPLLLFDTGWPAGGGTLAARRFRLYGARARATAARALL